MSGLAIAMALNVVLVQAAARPAAPAQATAPAQAAEAPPATRAEALDQRRAAREQSLTPYRPGRIERLLFYVEDKRVLQRLNPPEGVYPTFRSITTGSGLGVGAGYRLKAGRGRVRFDVSGAWTARSYKAAQVSIAVPRLGRRPIELRAGTRWYDYTQEDFFGLGPGTARSDRVNYALEGWDTYTQLQTRKAGWLVVSGRVGIHRTQVGAGQDARFPSLEARFADDTAPGLLRSPTLAYGEVSAGIDTRDQPGNTRGGGLYRVTFGGHRDRHQEGFDFNRIDAQAMQVFPIFDKKRAIALHATASRVDPLAGNRVPFFLIPTVGGGDSLRGYRDFRFRDAAAVNLNAEYRWEAFSGLDLALFADAGDVGPTLRSIASSRLRTSWGGGFRFNTNRQVFLRIDVARGREGTRVWVKLGPVFGR